MTENLLKGFIQTIESTGIEVWVMTCDGGSSSFNSQSGRLKLIDLIFYDVP
jgi:hypothetical protein